MAHRTITALYVVALALWAGGLVVLGAVVAPTVFRIVPAPTSADAMTVVFRRFDMIAMTCAAIGLVSEAALSRTRKRTTRLDLVRGAGTVLASILAVVLGLQISPRIDALHRGGAIRGLDEAGQELERLHRIAEGVAKGELLVLLVVLVLAVVAIGEPRTASVRDRREGKEKFASPGM